MDFRTISGFHAQVSAPGNLRKRHFPAQVTQLEVLSFRDVHELSQTRVLFHPHHTCFFTAQRASASVSSNLDKFLASYTALLLQKVLHKNKEHVQTKGIQKRNLSPARLQLPLDGKATYSLDFQPENSVEKLVQAVLGALTPGSTYSW